MERVIEVYHKDDKNYGDQLVREIKLPEIPLSILQEIFSEPKGNEMYEVFPIDMEKSRRLAKYVDVDYKFNKYSYFLCTYE
ncbi:DUF7683 domain-containing protein [Larsenimonas salina]|uniref:DUF7683 domain-containing protein n=1 Tax=Larsenimonas salina TaxID=1295565 RepID=UPI003D9A1B84